jgi:hypothetical protein
LQIDWIDLAVEIIFLALLAVVGYYVLRDRK